MAPASTADRGRGARLVFLHGFTQTHHHWHRVALALGERLGDDTALAFVDLPGHGVSTDDASGIADASAAAAALAGPGTYVGYSMGGRMALLAALSRPDLVERLVLIGATAGLEHADARAARRMLDGERAEQLERAGVDAFLDEWLTAPMFAGLPDDADGLAHRRRNTAAGLAHSLRVCGTGSQPSIWDRLAEIGAPTLVLAGEHDAKFIEIGERLAGALPHATFAMVPGAGHAAHIEQPGATCDLVAHWLAES